MEGRTCRFSYLVGEFLRENGSLFYRIDDLDVIGSHYYFKIFRTHYFRTGRVRSFFVLQGTKKIVLVNGIGKERWGRYIGVRIKSPRLKFYEYNYIDL